MYASGICFFILANKFYNHNICLYCNIALATLVVISSITYKDEKDDNRFWVFMQPFSFFMSMSIGVIGSSALFIFLQFFKSCTFVFYLIIGFIAFLIIFYLFVQNVFQWAKAIKMKNQIRLFYKYIVIESVLLFVVVNLWGTYLLWKRNAFLYSSLDEGVIYLSYFLSISYLIFWAERLYNIHIGYNDVKDKILFLRPFQLDRDIENKLIGIIRNVFLDKKIVRIGNPKCISNSHEFVQIIFLNDNNWKDKVHQYAKEACLIVIAIDCPLGHKCEGYSTFKDITGNIVTEGVLWEILEHENLQDKTIYYIAHLPSFPIESFNGKILFEAFKAIQNNIKTESLFVCVDKHSFFTTKHPALIKPMLEFRGKCNEIDLPDNVITLTQFDDPSNPGMLKSTWLTIRD